MTARPLTTSPFGALEHAFALLVTGPRPLALDGTAVPGLPDRAVPLGELRSRLLHPSASFALRDEVVRRLVALAQAEGGNCVACQWGVGLAGVLLPGLRSAVRSLVEACPAKADDIEAEALASFLAAVAAAPPGGTHLAGRLCGQARTGAKRVLRAEVAERAGAGHDPVSAAPPRPWAHPDMVLGGLARAGVVDAADAELIGETRIGDVPLADAAGALGISYAACQMRRARAEAKVSALLSSAGYDPSDYYSPFGSFVGNRRVGAISSSVRGRPRQVRGTGPVTGQASPGTEEEVRAPAPARPALPGRPLGPTPRACPGRTEEGTTARQPHTTTTQLLRGLGHSFRGLGRALRRLGRALAGRRARSLARPAAAVLAAVVLVALAFPAVAQAATAAPTLSSVIDNLRTWIVGILAGLATLFLTIGGVRYLTAGGDPVQVQRAKVALESAAIGYALAVLAPLLVTILTSVVG
jgi:hypothetical protein